MTVRRVMGIETEYGILQPGRPLANPMLLSSHVVAVHAAAREGARTKARWDYDDEDPLHDARGFHLQRASAHPSLLTDDPEKPAPSGDGPQAAARGATTEEYEDPGAANVILTNGARLYVDHAHPEYSSPEVTNPLDAVRWDRAGERVMLASVRALASTAALPDVALYKNNVDGKGATYGTHENYLVDRAVPFHDLAARLIPFLVTRQVFTGAGRVGLGQRGEEPGFQLSQRADYMEAEIGLETTLRRPIINTRDEPHADPDRWRRLHVIIGDANMLEVATYLKLGTTSLVLWLIERAVAEAGAGGSAGGDRPADAARPRARRARGQPRPDAHRAARARRRPPADGARGPARVPRRGPRGARQHAGDEPDPQTADVLARWASVLDRLGTDPASCAREVEWLAKLRLLEGMRRRDRLAWDHPRLAAMDLQWSDVRPERGLYHRLVAGGRGRAAGDAEEVADAVAAPAARTPGRTSAARRWRGTAARSRPRAGTRWCSTCPARRRCSGCRCATRCAGRTRTSGELLDRSPDADGAAGRARRG